LGILEFNSIAIGIKALDEMVKIAPIRIIDAKTVCPGKYIVIITGDVAAVDASLTIGKNVGEGYIVDELFIPNLHKGIFPAIVGVAECKLWDAIGIVESFSITASVEAGDIAAKTTDVTIVEIRLGIGIGGKSYVKMIGNIHDIESAVNRATDYIKMKGLLCTSTIIPRPHPDIKPFFL